MRMMMIRLLATSCAFVAACGASADPRTINDAVYTNSQAQSGEKLYAEHCLMCHDKRYFRPVLKAWNGQSLGILFTVMSTSMPESNPGALPRDDYVAILAYILSLNRYPAGDTELAWVDGALDDIVIADRD